MASKSTADLGLAALDGKASICLLLLALQFGVQPVLTRNYTPPGIIRSTVILTQEIVKFFMALFMLRISNAAHEVMKGRLHLVCSGCRY